MQRVSEANVTVDGRLTGAIGPGLVVLLGVGREDGEAQAVWLIDKILGLRIFEDEAGKMNVSLLETGGALLVVSQFTLYGDTRKGRRPSFDAAAPPQDARRLYEFFVDTARGRGVQVETGEFQARMRVSLVNEGPVTLICETPAP
ncbi:MAG TPA: D-aminoacyl-tRNA deacylase [Bryobacteraceae bacterium]|nr:D-aminoacyl-tRNA deacylase [Bryobacteraceae bacterium]